MVLACGEGNHRKQTCVLESVTGVSECAVSHSEWDPCPAVGHKKGFMMIHFLFHSFNSDLGTSFDGLPGAVVRARIRVGGRGFVSRHGPPEI